MQNDMSDYRNFDEDTMGARKRWLTKPVFESINLWESIPKSNIKYQGYGEFGLFYGLLEGRTVFGKIATNIFTEDYRPRPMESLHLKPLVSDWHAYNRISIWVYPKAEGFVNFYSHYFIKNDKNSTFTHTESLIPNRWNRVLFEFDEEFVTVDLLGLAFFHMGVPDEAKPKVEFILGELVLERVEPDYDHGWSLGNRIAYSHCGYLPYAKKTALVQNSEEEVFRLKNAKNETVYRGEVQKLTTTLGDFRVLDFSSFTESGLYYLEIDNIKTSLFPIGDNPFHSSIEKSLTFLFTLRCGDDILGVHSPCHLNSYTTHPDGRMVPNFGGWHDAGDVSQFEICTAEIAHALLDLADAYRDTDSAFAQKILAEARYGINWLLRTRFGDGFRALAVEYSIWQPNVVSSKETINLNQKGNIRSIAENGAYENFLASGALAKAALAFKELDKNFSSWCQRTACEDFALAMEGYQKGCHTKRWGVIPKAQICGEAALDASLIYQLTGDQSYLDIASQMADIVISCQEQELNPAWDYPLRGFFYEDPDHKYLLTFEHRGHEQSPIQGLIKLLTVAKDHPNKGKWEQAVNLYKEYLERTAFATTPYGMLPAHIYIKGKINTLRFTVPAGFNQDNLAEYLNRQSETGVRIGEGVYLRRFPIAISRRGFHATLLSKTKALSLIARYLNDQNLKQMAIDQIEWVLGKNPFSSSTMYGEGENFHPLYVAFSRQLIGALPVGIKTKAETDEPYWPVGNNAVYKEVWGHTTGKFLWVLADILKMK